MLLWPVQQGVNQAGGEPQGGEEKPSASPFADVETYAAVAVVIIALLATSLAELLGFRFYGAGTIFRKMFK